MPASVLQRVLIASETTWGTRVTPTAKLMGLTSVEHRIAQEYHQVDERGTLAPSRQSALVAESGGVALGMDLSYEDIMYPLAALDTAATTGVNPYTHIYVPPLLLTNAFAPFTLNLDQGDATGEWELAGGIATGLSITGAAKGVWKASQEFIGQKIVETSVTTLPADRTIELIRMADTVLSIDAEAGTIGATAITSALVSFALTIQTGRHLKPRGGSLYPVNYGDSRWSGTLALRVEVNATTLAYVTSALAGHVKRQIRLKATSSTKSATLDFTGFLRADPIVLFSDEDGNAVLDLAFQGAYNTTMAQWFTGTIVNAVATLP